MGVVSKKGLHRKYAVTRVDGQEDGPEAQYFVLRVDKDPAALSALVAYAGSVRKENPELADDLDIWLLSIVLGDKGEVGTKIGRLEMVACAICERVHWVLRLPQEEHPETVTYRCLVTMQTWTRLYPEEKE